MRFLLSSKFVLGIVIILTLQPFEWFKFLYIISNPNYIPTPNISESYYKHIADYMNNGNFLDYIVGNLMSGKIASLLWLWENGRFFQAPTLFMLGMLAGRKQLFVQTINNIKFWKLILKVSLVVFVPLYTLVLYLSEILSNTYQLTPLLVIFKSWANFASMLTWVSISVLLFYSENWKVLLSKLVPFGKMGLSNYIIQSVIGSTLYCKYGFGLYQYTGATMCLIIGIVLFLGNVYFCKWWLQSHRQGPLESIWHKLTWIKI